MIIVSITVYFFYKFKDSEGENKGSNLKMNYYVEMVYLMNRINGREIVLYELSDCPLNNYMKPREDRFHFAIIVRPGGCAPCIDKSIHFYYQQMQELELDSLIIGCFENKRHSQVWFRDRMIQNYYGYVLIDQPIYFSENAYLAVMQGNRIVSLALWHPDYEEFSKQQIKRTIANFIQE